MSLLRKLAGETALYGLSSIVGRLLNYLLVPLYARSLSVADNGVLTELYAYSAFLMVIFSYRMESAFFRYGTPTADRERAFSTGIVSLIGSTLVITLVLLGLAGPIADALAYAGHPEYIRYFALILALDCLSELPFARLRLEQRPRRFVAGKLLNIGLNIVLNLFWLAFCPWAARHGWDWVRAVWSPEVQVGYVFISNLIASLGTLVFLGPQLRFNSGLFDKTLLWKMLGYAWPLILVQFAGIINSLSDRVMLKWLLPGNAEENLIPIGIYGNNYKLAALITIFTQAYRYAAEPFFFRNAEQEDAPQVQAEATKWFTIVATVGMLGVLLFLDLLKYFLTPAYFEGLDVVPVLLAANVLLGIYYNFSVWYRLKDKTLVGAYIALAGALLTIGLNLVLIPALGYKGAAWTALSTYLFMCAITWQLGKKHYSVPYPLGEMAFFIGLAFGCYFLSEWMDKVIAQSVLVWAFRAALFGMYLFFVYRAWRQQNTQFR